MLGHLLAAACFLAITGVAVVVAAVYVRIFFLLGDRYPGRLRWMLLWMSMVPLSIVAAAVAKGEFGGAIAMFITFAGALGGIARIYHHERRL